MTFLTYEIANGLWNYDPKTGYFFWQISPKIGILAGDRAGYFDGAYWRLRYKRRNYKASRVAWLLSNKKWPSLYIDHINGVKTDDRIANLREASPSQNSMNSKMYKTNKLKTKGVHRHKCGSYQAQIRIAGTTIYLGLFKDMKDAKAAYNAAAINLHGEYARI